MTALGPPSHLGLWSQGTLLGETQALNLVSGVKVGGGDGSERQGGGSPPPQAHSVQTWGWRHHRQRRAGGIWTHLTEGAVPSYPNPRPGASATAWSGSSATFPTCHKCPGSKRTRHAFLCVPFARFPIRSSLLFRGF